MEVSLRNCIEAFQKTFDQIDNVLKGHSLEVTYIFLKFLEISQLYTEEEIIDLCAVAFMHDIGAYKTEQGKNLVKFEKLSPNNHSIYGYLFVRKFSPLPHLSEIILYHHIDLKLMEKVECKYKYEASLLNLADKIGVFYKDNGYFDLDKIYNISKCSFSREYIEVFRRLDNEYGIISKIKSGECIEEMMKIFSKRLLSENEVFNYAKMLVFSIDFRSEHTVYHSIAVEVLSEIIAQELKLGEEEVAVIKAAAFLHDIGKIVTPIEILESTGRLNNEEMKIMKKHVDITYKILSEIGLNRIRDIAAFHHEKLDGSGYPDGLKGSEITLPMRILIIADIISALLGKRSYKEPFSKEQIITILKEMAVKEIDPDIVGIIIENYDDIMAILYDRCKEVYLSYKEINYEYEEIKVHFEKRFII